ncbi:hypothetical protein C9988_03150 [Pseudidiomarina aestuarii]|nr:hypothetical protein C9988_03150 [Pseudidiomarina aestuarii]
MISGKALGIVPLLFSAGLSAAEPGVAAQTAPLPAAGTCTQVSFTSSNASKWPLPLLLCQYSVAEFNTLKARPVVDNDWLPNQQSYQGLADNLQDSRLPSIALAQGQRWYTLLAEEAAAQNAVVQLTELVSPYFGCVLQISDEGFADPCVGARWDRLGRLLAPVSDLPNQSLRQFPFKLLKEEVVLGEADTELNWQLHAFEPDLQDTTVPLFDRIVKGMLWGMVDEVTELWPLFSAQGELTESEQAQLFIMAVSKQHAAAVQFLAAQGLNPQAKTDFGDSALSVAKMLESDSMIQLLNELGASADSQTQ